MGCGNCSVIIPRADTMGCIMEVPWLCHGLCSPWLYHRLTLWQVVYPLNIAGYDTMQEIPRCEFTKIDDTSFVATLKVKFVSFFAKKTTTLEKLSKLQWCMF